MIERLENGIMFDELPEAERSVVIFLDASGICEPRCDIQDGLYLLTEKGKTELEKNLQIGQQRTEKAAKDIENEVKRVKEREQDRRHNWAVNVVSALIGALVGAVVGGLAGYWATLATLGLK